VRHVGDDLYILMGLKTPGCPPMTDEAPRTVPSSVTVGEDEVTKDSGGRLADHCQALGFTEFSAVRAGPRATRSRESPVLAAFPSAAAL
jgi:hypothetical protein